MSSRNTRIYERGQAFSLWLRNHVVEHSDRTQRGLERALVLDSLELVGALLLAAVFPADAKEHSGVAQRTLARLRGELARATRLGSVSADVGLRAYTEIAALDRMLHGQRANARSSGTACAASATTPRPDRPTG